MNDDVIELSFDRIPTTYAAQAKPQWKSPRTKDKDHRSRGISILEKPQLSPGRRRKSWTNFMDCVKERSLILTFEFF